MKHIRLIKKKVISSSKDRRVKLIGTIDVDSEIHEYWFDFPIEYEDYLSESGNCWLLVMLPFAVKIGATISLDLHIDPMLFENIIGVVDVWRNWYKDVKRIKINAPIAKSPAGAEKSMAFFSGGIDSWFTLLRHKEKIDNRNFNGALDFLVTVWGFDVGLDNPDGFNEIKNSTQKTADNYGLKLIDVWTNLRGNSLRFGNTPWWRDWGPIAHGAALACVGLTMEGLFSKVTIASTRPYSGLKPWGSHPMTDPLFSTSSLKIFHDGAVYGRVEKTKKISSLPDALDSLRVCWKGQDSNNCSNCNKCYRTMITLDLLGVLRYCKSFEKKKYSINEIKKVYHSSESEEYYYLEILELAKMVNHREIFDSINISIKRSKVKRFFVKIGSFLCKLPKMYRIGRRFNSIFTGKSIN